MFKGYIFLQFYVDQFQMQHSYRGKLASNVKWAMQVASEKGASSWLATLPIAQIGRVAKWLLQTFVVNGEQPPS